MIHNTFGRIATLGVLTTALAAAWSIGEAQDKAAATKGAPPASGKSAASGRHPVAELQMAERLAQYGDRMQDPLALLMAARIKQALGAQEAAREPKTQGGQGDAPKAAGPDTSVQGLIARSKVLAKGRADLLALTADVEKERPRGRLEGPQVTMRVLRGGATDTYTVQLQGGVEAVIGITGDGAADLDLFIEDENGTTLCKADGDKDDEICRFTPRTTGMYRVIVRNVGKIANQFLFVSN